MILTAILRKTAVSFVMSVHPSVWNNSASAKTGFHEILYMGIVLQYFEKIQV
jgi:hypothetical protein